MKDGMQAEAKDQIITDTRKALGLVLTSQPSYTVSGTVENASGRFIVTYSLYRAANMYEKPWYVVYTLRSALPGKLETWVWGLDRANDIQQIIWVNDIQQITDNLGKNEVLEHKLVKQIYQFMYDYKGF